MPMDDFVFPIEYSLCWGISQPSVAPQGQKMGNFGPRNHYVFQVEGRVVGLKFLLRTSRPLQDLLGGSHERTLTQPKPRIGVSEPWKVWHRTFLEPRVGSKKEGCHCSQVHYRLFFLMILLVVTLPFFYCRESTLTTIPFSLNFWWRRNLACQIYITITVTSSR